MSTYGSGMWDSMKETDGVGNLIRDAVRETEREIFDSAMDSDPPDDSFDDSLEELEDFEGNTHSDSEWYQLNPDGSDPYEDSAPEPQYRQQQYQQPEQEIDLFENPEARFLQHRNQIAEDRYGGPLPPQSVPNWPQWDGPDPMLDERAALQHAAMRGAQMAETARFDQQRVNSSMESAAEAYGEEFQTAFRAVTSAPQNDPHNIAMAQRIWSSPNPGAQIMEEYGGLLGRDMISRKLGGQGYLPRQQIDYASMSRDDGVRGRNAPRTQEDLLEDSIFNYAFQD